MAGRAIMWGLVGGFLVDASGVRDEASVMAVTLPAASHSSTIALNRQDRRLWVVNREANSVSVIQVRDSLRTNFQDKAAARKFTTPGTGLSQAPPQGGARAASPCSSRIRTTAPSYSTFSAHGCSPRSGAASPRGCSSCLAATERSRQQ